jgi:hypothetical protein
MSLSAPRAYFPAGFVSVTGFFLDVSPDTPAEKPAPLPRQPNNPPRGENTLSNPNRLRIGSNLLLTKHLNLSSKRLMKYPG